MYSFKGGVKLYGTDGLLFKDPFFQPFHDGPFSFFGVLTLHFVAVPTDSLHSRWCLEKIFLPKADVLAFH
jgi:hypothetical protein